jgi:hypothetical protein
MEKQILKFQISRWLMLFGLFAAVIGLMFSFLNSKYGFVTQEANWPVSLIGVGFLLLGFFLYRCPYCGKLPENDDVPLFNPSKCDSCGSRLR